MGVLWFEVAVLRRANYQRWSLLVLVVSSLLTGGFAPEFVPLFAFVGPLGAVTGAYLSGLVRHLRLRTLVLVPGGTARRVVAAETVHAVFACLGLALSLAVGGIAGGYGGGRIATLLLQGAVLVIMAFAVRVVAAALSYRDGIVPGALFHVTLTLAAAGAAGVVVATSWVASKVAVPLAVASTVLLVVAPGLWASGTRLLRDRIEARPPSPLGGRRPPGRVSAAAA
jgi:sporulation killing factor system integral membrane protein